MPLTCLHTLLVQMQMPASALNSIANKGLATSQSFTNEQTNKGLATSQSLTTMPLLVLCSLHLPTHMRTPWPVVLSYP